MKKFILYCFLILPLLSHSQDTAEVVVRGYNIKQFRYWDYTRIKVRGKVFLYDDVQKINLGVDNINFLGEDLKIDIPMVPVSEAQKFINGRPELKNGIVFEAINLEYRLKLNNNLLKDWTAAKNVNECTRDTIQRSSFLFEMNPPFLARNSNNVDLLLDNSSVVAPTVRREQPEPKITNIPIENKIIFARKMKVNDSVRIDMRFSGNPKILGSFTVTRIPIKPFLILSLTDEEADAYLLDDGVAARYIKKLRDSSLSGKYLISKWDSLPSNVTINYPSSVQRIILRFKDYGAISDSALITRFGMDIDSLKEIGNTKEQVYLRNLKPGNTYLLSTYYKYQPENAVLYKIVIAPTWYQKSSFKWILGISISLLLLAFAYLFYSYKIRRQKQEQARIDLELKSIRSQLNPHFIFNALSSIQGLINNNEIDKANIYLSEFGSLMRDTLSGNNTINNTLSAEIKILDRYLQLEQLRFGFKFNINTSDKINGSEIEIPSLLLQPLVENAVKHGVSALRDQGKIDIDFEKHDADLVIKIKDNGKGFSEEPPNGYGIKLTRERIQLLNQVNKEQPVSFDINSAKTGTTVLLSFKNWF